MRTSKSGFHQQLIVRKMEVKIDKCCFFEFILNCLMHPYNCIKQIRVPGILHMLIVSLKTNVASFCSNFINFKCTRYYIEATYYTEQCILSTTLKHPTIQNNVYCYLFY
jgi:hypothetical protein